MNTKKIYLGLFLLITIILSACQSKSAPTEDSADHAAPLLGTIITAKAYGPQAEEALSLAFKRVREIENKMSRLLDGSEVDLINQNAGKQAVPISPDTYFVIDSALDYAKKTDGTFNPVVGNLIELWAIGTEDAKVPTQEEIDLFLPYLDYHQLVLTENPYTAELTSDKIKLDLGAIAKGYAGDEMARILLEKGITSALLNLGGNVVVIGNKPDDTPWTIGIQNPLEEERGEIAGIVKATNTSVVTSGSYERFFEEDNVRYHHIMDPATGYPAENGIISSTIISPSSTQADALSTAVYILGKEKGLSLIESLSGVEAIIITDDHKIHTTSGIDGNLFTLKSEAFLYEKRR